MTIEIVDSSPQAVELAKTVDVTKKGVKYPFAKLEKGKSFTVSYDDANLNSLQVLCSQKSKDGKVFKLLKHDELKIAEVARIA